jgi:hypothetical protein
MYTATKIQQLTDHQAGQTGSLHRHSNSCAAGQTPRCRNGWQYLSNTPEATRHYNLYLLKGNIPHALFHDTKAEQWRSKISERRWECTTVIKLTFDHVLSLLRSGGWSMTINFAMVHQHSRFLMLLFAG